MFSESRAKQIPTNLENCDEFGSTHRRPDRSRRSRLNNGRAEMIRYLSENPEFFDPETLDIMIRALDEAWKRFQGSGVRLDGQAGAARTALAKHIVDMTREGE